jgi:hypothetical protein
MKKKMTYNAVEDFRRKVLEMDKHSIEKARAYGIIQPMTALQFRIIELERGKNVFTGTKFRWIEHERDGEIRVCGLYDKDSHPYPWSGVHLSAPMIYEMWDMLPDEIIKDNDKFYKNIKMELNFCECFYCSGLHYIFHSDMHADMEEAIADTLCQVLKETTLLD